MASAWIIKSTFIILSLVQLSVASNPFSSNVIALTHRNWRREVEESPHAVFVNICRVGWGYCQQLTPEWEKLAGATKGMVKIAYWDTEQNGPRPPMLGEFQGTPTIRLFKPKKKQKPGSSKEKITMEYQYERKAKDMKKYLDQQMPEFAEKVVNGQKDMDTFEAKAAKYGLPKAILFTSKSDTMPLTKYLSTEFRRKLLFAEVKPTKKNKEIMEKYGVTDLPALFVVSNGSTINEEMTSDSSNEEEIVRYDGDSFSKIKLESFLSKYALKKIVEKKKNEEEEKPQEKPSKVKVEL